MAQDKLADVLIDRAIKEPIKPTLDFSSKVPNDYAIRKALQMLHGIGITGVSTPRVTGPPTGQFNGATRGYVLKNKPYAYIVDDGTFRAANKGNDNKVKDIAAVLAHEDTHLKADNPYDEYEPYQAQLRVLNELEAPHSSRHRVRAAQQQIAPRKR